MNPFLIWAAWADAAMKMTDLTFPDAAVARSMMLRQMRPSSPVGNVCAPSVARSG